VIRPEAVDA